MQYFKDSRKFVEGKLVFCGIDVHRTHWIVCFYCDGEVVEKMRLHAKYPVLRHAFLSRYSSAREIRVVYEAGFSGFWLYRKLVADGYDCTVTPPNRVPKSGDKVKTDKRDAEKLAQFLAAGVLKAVAVPSPRAARTVSGGDVPSGYAGSPAGPGFNRATVARRFDPPTAGIPLSGCLGVFSIFEGPPSS